METDVGGGSREESVEEGCEGGRKRNNCGRKEDEKQREGSGWVAGRRWCDVREDVGGKMIGKRGKGRGERGRGSSPRFQVFV